MNCELPDVQAGLENAEESEIKTPISTGSSKKARESQKNTYFCFTDYAKAFDCADHKKTVEIFQEMRLASWEVCMQDNKQQLELDMEQWTGSKSGKEYIKAVYCHPAYLT